MSYINELMGRNEHVVFLTRQHWIQIVPRALLDLLIILSLIILGAVLYASTNGISMIASIVLSIIPMIHFAHRLATWWNEQYVVTNRRVIQVEGVLEKHVIDSSLEKVNDVVLRQSAWGRLLNFGDIEILTGSEIGVNALTRIHKPILFKTEMLNQKESMGEIDAFETRAKRVLASEAPTSGDIPELIAEFSPSDSMTSCRIAG